MKHITKLFLLLFAFIGFMPIVFAETCKSGYQQVGLKCVKSVKAQCRSGSCWCTPGSNQKLIDGSCVDEYFLEPPTDENGNSNVLECENGYISDGVKCYKVVGNASYRDGSYYCNPPYIKIGNSCVESEIKNSVNNNPYEEPKNTDEPSTNTDVISEPIDVEVKFCEDINILKGLRVVGIIINICKILIPVILIIIGIKSLFNAVIEDDDKATKSAVNGFIKKIIVSVVVFLIPTFINAVLLQIDKWNNLEGDFENCSVCSINYDKEMCDSLIGD